MGVRCGVRQHECTAAAGDDRTQDRRGVMTMDPNANLREQITLASRIIYDEGANPDDAVRLAELVEALHEWIDRGGFLPDRWEVAQKRARK